MKKNLCLIGLILLTSFNIKGQSQTIEKITEKLDLFHQKYPEEIVYLQTDRANYSPGEIIWFKAYVMEDLLSQPNSRSLNLYVALVDQDGQEIAYEKFFIENNQVKGNITIPKILSEGKYMLTAYSSWMVNSQVDRVFLKEIKIVKEDENKLLVAIKLKDKIYTSNKELTANLEFIGKDNSPVAASFNYKLEGRNGKIVKGKGRADEQGKAEIKIALPDLNTEKDLKLLVNALYKGFKADAGIVIPTPENCLDVKFYPEGGMFVYGAESKIAFRAFNTSDQPEDFEGGIFDRNNNLVKKIESSYKGMGSFLFTPENGQIYYLKIYHPAGITKIFDLPLPANKGLTLSITPKTKDTLTLKIVPVNLDAQVYNFIGQTKGKVYWSKSEKIEKTTDIEIPIADFPLGLAEFVVFDPSLNLVARRLFFINKEKKLNISILTDKLSYSPGEKIEVHIKVNDNYGQPVAANLGCSAAYDGLQEYSSNNHNFLTYTRLKSDLSEYLPTPSFYLYDLEMSREALDNLVITSASNRFTWGKILSTSETDASFRIVDGVSGLNAYKRFDKKIDDYVALILNSMMKSPGKSYPVYKKNNLREIRNNGNVSVQKKQYGYSSDRNIFDIIRQIKPYQMIDGKIVFASSGPNSINYQSGALIVVDGIRMGTDVQILYTIPITDIAKINVTTNPADIQQYTGLNNVGIIEIITKRGGDIQKSPDNSVIKNTLDLKPDNQKTLYWNPGIQTDNSGFVSFSFINSDIPSDIIITVEGLTNSGLVGSKNIKYSIR